jgi:SAM-dependent methyltransferase
MRLTSVLSFSWMYDLSQWLFGAARLRRWFVHELLRPSATDTLFEAGCGTGELLALMPPIAGYFGYDISEDYIAKARQRFPQQRFEATTGEDLLKLPAAPSDIVFCIGLLHHLTDAQVLAVLELAVKNMRPGARFVALEPCFLRHQTPLSRWMISQDRGEYIRQAAEYERLLGSVFAEVKADVVTGLNNLPYVHLALEARSPR